MISGKEKQQPHQQFILITYSKCAIPNANKYIWVLVLIRCWSTRKEKNKLTNYLLQELKTDSNQLFTSFCWQLMRLVFVLHWTVIKIGSCGFQAVPYACNTTEDALNTTNFQFSTDLNEKQAIFRAVCGASNCMSFVQILEKWTVLSHSYWFIRNIVQLELPLVRSSFFFALHRPPRVTYCIDLLARFME